MADVRPFNIDTNKSALPDVVSHAAINEQFDGGDVVAVAGREEDNRFTIIQEVE